MMADGEKTREQLQHELRNAKQKVAALESMLDRCADDLDTLCEDDRQEDAITRAREVAARIRRLREAGDD